MLRLANVVKEVVIVVLIAGLIAIGGDSAQNDQPTPTDDGINSFVGYPSTCC